MLKHVAENQVIKDGPAILDDDRFEPANRRYLSAPAIRTFTAVCDLWGLSEAGRLRILGGPSRSAYGTWTKAAREHGEITLSADVLTRISAVLGIHSALAILHMSEAEGVAWLKTPHSAPVFGGQPPMNLVTSGTQDGLLIVRRFLDAARGGLYMAPNDLDKIYVPYEDKDIVFA